MSAITTLRATDTYQSRLVVTLKRVSVPPSHLPMLLHALVNRQEPNVFPLFAARNRLKQLRGRALVDWQAPMLLSRLQRALNFCGGVIRK